MKILHTDKAIIVEGKYDKIKLSAVTDAVIICTDGYGIFTDKDKMRIIRHYAEKTGIVILTDSDSAGFKIRNHIKGCLKDIPEGNIVNVYIPDVLGKEKRKSAPSKEGKLGVEGIKVSVLEEAFAKAGITADSKAAVNDSGIDKMLMYELGYTGRPNSAERRKVLLRHFDLPELMTINAITDILSTMTTAEELCRITEEMFGENE